MSIFCKHAWVTAEKTIVPAKEFKSGNCSEYLVERLLAGVVTVLRVCSKCGIQEKFEMLGAPAAAPGEPGKGDR